MKQIIYASTAHPDVTIDTVQEILTVANRENEKHGITGALFFDGIYFLQCIEGPKDAVDRLLVNIRNDSRHNDIKVISDALIPQRDFQQWHMGYVNNSEVIKDILRQETRKEAFFPHTFDAVTAKSISQQLIGLV